jgi:hypothetical protein
MVTGHFGIQYARSFPRRADTSADTRPEFPIALTAWYGTNVLSGNVQRTHWNTGT